MRDRRWRGSRNREAAHPMTSDRCRQRVDATIRADVLALGRYAASSADGWIKLDAMENPYPQTAELRAALAQTLAGVDVNRYPDSDARAVKRALREHLVLDDGVGLLVGNGSDEIIQLLTAAVAGEDAAVLAPEPSFVMYRRNALVARARYVGVPLADDFALDGDAMLTAIARERPALVWLAFPNNPTGNAFDVAAIERVIAAAPGLVAIDEAYYAFADTSFLSRVLEYPNVVVVRTVSKVGMAGLRLGYVCGDPAWIDALERIRPPYNVNSLTQAAAPVMLQHAGVFAAQAHEIRQERTRVHRALAALPGLRAFATQTNFVLVRVPDARTWFAALCDARILVKNLDGAHPLLANCLRITVGTPPENDAVLQTLQRAFGWPGADVPTLVEERA